MSDKIKQIQPIWENMSAFSRPYTNIIHHQHITNYSNRFIIYSILLRVGLAMATRLFAFKKRDELKKLL